MVRIIVSIIIALAITVGGFFLFKKFSKAPEEADKVVRIVAKSVYTQKAENKEIPIQIVSNGQLVASRRVTLTSEVTGVLRSSTFKEGTIFNNGQTICVIDDAESKASVASQRSNFYAQLLRIMPDLKLDYFESWATWDGYLKRIDINQDLPDLPAFTDDRAKNFITANGIISSFQNVKNLEIRSGKYSLRAPFNGVITQANVQEGSLVTMNQPIGEISSIGDYELELPVNIEFLEFLKVGSKIELTTIDGKKTYNGRIERINPRADVNSQSIVAYVRIRHKELREGMFLQATIDAGKISNAIEIDRKLLNGNNEIFVLVNDTTIGLEKVNPVYFKNETAIVQGLTDGKVFVKKALSGAYVGMKVKVINEGNSNL